MERTILIKYYSLVRNGVQSSGHSFARRRCSVCERTKHTLTENQTYSRPVWSPLLNFSQLKLFSYPWVLVGLNYFSFFLVSLFGSVATKVTKV